MSRSRTALLAPAFAIIAVAATVILRKQNSPRFAWDFTRGHTTSSTGIPRRTAGAELIYELKPRGRVVAYLAPGHTFDERVLTATFYQNKPGIIDAVSFNLEPQTLDEAFNSAMKFAREWNLPTEPLVKWLENAHSGRFEYAQTIRNDLRPTIAVEVFKTYDHDKPFRVMLQVGWPFWDEPATSQSTPG